MNLVRPGREQPQRSTHVPGCGWWGHLHFWGSAYIYWVLCKPKRCYHAKWYTMARSPLYLQLSRHNVYYFRMRVPLPLRGALGCTHIKRSLATRKHREALVRGAQLLDKLQVVFDAAMRGESVSIDPLPWSPARKVIPQVAISLSEAESAEKSCPVISEVLSDYLQEQQREGVSVKTLSDKRSVVQLFVRIVGDLPISDINREHARRFKSVALRLPPRINLLSDKPLEQLIADATETISITTFNNYVKNLNTVFGYAETEGYIANNPLKGLRVQQRQKVNTLRARFTDDDLIKLCNAVKKYRNTEKYYRYWLPMLGMYTGARLNELCQLYLGDFVEIDGIHCIHFQVTHGDQSLKSPTSERVVPIHSKLLESGVMDFVEMQRCLGHERLFPSLSLHKQNGYSQTPSRWFSGLRETLGFNDAKGRKDFHSFRHTVADNLKQRGVAESFIGGILGHTTGGITFTRYGKDFRPHVLQPAVELLCFSE